MKLLTKALEKKLIANIGKENVEPVVKFFGGAACTWLITEYDPDQDSFFGLCDLGLGSPELGYVSRTELEEIRFRPFGLGVERDLHFKADKKIQDYALAARLAGRIVE